VGIVTEDDVYPFVASSIPSIWGLELLLLLKHVAPNGRRAHEFVRELRSSTTAAGDRSDIRDFYDLPG